MVKSNSAKIKKQYATKYNDILVNLIVIDIMRRLILQQIQKLNCLYFYEKWRNILP